MNSIVFHSQLNTQYTLIPNWFIDNYMTSSNGDFVKVYILLLKYSCIFKENISTDEIADSLNLTISDVKRAFKYWEQNGLLEVSTANSIISSISLVTPMPVESNSLSVEGNSLSFESSMSMKPDPLPDKKPSYSNEEIASMTDEKPLYKDLIYITGKYLGKILNQNDLSTLISFHDWLGLPFEVIEWLIEYCASNNHRNMRYIEKVALEWADLGIDSLEKAKQQTEVFNKSYFSIKKALGLGDKNPVAFEIKFMDKWLKDYAFDLSIILEACNRTMMQAPSASFQYADKILSHWKKANVHTLKDIELLDKEHESQKSSSKASIKKEPSNNKFINFEQREYDYDSIEKKAMQMLLKENTEGGYK